MSDRSLKVGDVVVNEVRQYAKILSFSNGVYGLSGWTTLGNAEKATVVQKFLNTYGVSQANLRLVKGAVEDDAPASFDDSTGEKPTKSALKKLSADAVKELAVKLGLDAEGNKTNVLEKLYTHYEL